MPARVRPVPLTRSREPTAARRALSRGIALAFVGIILMAGILRLARLHSIPPGLFFDEAANLFDIADILHGRYALYFPRNNGREPFFFYWASVFAALWGVTPYAIRLAAAVIGTLTVATTFACAREIARGWLGDRSAADWIAVAAGTVLGILYPHLHYSRIGLRAITLPFFLTLGYALVIRGFRRDSLVLLAAGGIVSGLNTYTYIAGRVAPLPVLVLGLVMALAQRSWRTMAWTGLVLALWALASLPLGIYALDHPGEVLGHTDDVSILNPANNHGDPVGAVAHGVVATLASYAIAGTPAAEQNLPGRPMLDPLLSLLGLAGLVFLAAGMLKQTAPPGAADGRLPRPAVAGFLVSWTLIFSAPSMLAVNPPGYIRMTGAFPALAVIVGFGAAAVVLVPGALDRWARVGIVLVLLGISASWTIRDYFLVWGPSPEAYHLMMGDKADSAAYLRQWAATDRVFLAPLYAQDNTIRFLTRSSPIATFDIGVSLVVPTDRSRNVRYVFPSDDQEEIRRVTAELPAPPRTEMVRDPRGRFPLLTVLELDRTALPEPPSTRRAVFDGGITLVRAVVAPLTAVPGQHLSVELVWLAEASPPIDYTVFLHLRDPAERTVAQVDRQPTAGSYPTSLWQAGDVIWDRYTLDLPSSLAPGSYHLVAGLYDLATMHRLTARLANGRIPASEVRIAEVVVRGG